MLIGESRNLVFSLVFIAWWTLNLVFRWLFGMLIMPIWSPLLCLWISYSGTVGLDSLFSLISLPPIYSFNAYSLVSSEFWWNYSQSLSEISFLIAKSSSYVQCLIRLATFLGLKLFPFCFPYSLSYPWLLVSACSLLSSVCLRFLKFHFTFACRCIHLYPTIVHANCGM